MASWTDIGTPEKTRETAKAVQLCFERRGAGGWGDPSSDKYLWVPKALYRERMRGNFLVQEIQTWFITKNGLWGLINHKVRGCCP